MVYATWLCKRALKIDKKTLCDLEKELLKLFGSSDRGYSYTIELADGRAVEFDSIDKVVDPKNYDNKKILAISIVGNKPNKGCFSFEISRAFIFSRKFVLDRKRELKLCKTAEMTYKFSEPVSNLESDSTFAMSEKLVEALNKWANARNDDYHKMIRPDWVDIVVMFLDFILFISAPIVYLVHMFGGTVSLGNLYLSKQILTVSVVFIALKTGFIIFNLVKTSLFPSVLFDWGKEKEKRDHLKKMRIISIIKKFGSLILSVALGLIINYISTLLATGG